MLKHKDHFHGSDLEKIEQIYGIRKDEITSFSANINPLGISPLLRRQLSEHVDVISSYPDRDYVSLRKCIAAYCGTEYENIIVGNGSSELISLLIQVRQPKKALILGPTYSEYERSIMMEGGTALYYPLQECDQFRLNTEHFIKNLNESIDMIILCNPNNPTSTAIPQKDMRKILDACKQYDIFVMVDETYIEFVENFDEIQAVPLTSYYNNIIILRGTSKFFAAPGLRLGCAITGNKDLIDYINAHKNPWMINSLAAAIQPRSSNAFLPQCFFQRFKIHKRSPCRINKQCLWFHFPNQVPADHLFIFRPVGNGNGYDVAVLYQFLQ